MKSCIEWQATNVQFKFLILKTNNISVYIFSFLWTTTKMTAIAAAEKKKKKDEMYYKFNTSRGMGYWKSRMKNYDDGEFTSKLTLFTNQILVHCTRFDQGLVLLYHTILIICLFIETTILVLWVLESLCKIMYLHKSWKMDASRNSPRFCKVGVVLRATFGGPKP